MPAKRPEDQPAAVSAIETPARRRWRVAADKRLGSPRVGLHVSLGDVIEDADFAAKLLAAGAQLEEVQ